MIPYFDYLGFLAYHINASYKVQLTSSPTDITLSNSGLQRQKSYVPVVSNTIAPAYKDYPQIHTFFMPVE